MPNTHVPAASEAMPAAEGIHIIGRFSGRLQPLGMPKGMDPREWRQSVEKRLNDLLDCAMSLVTALDLMEVDCDLESTDDEEASLGWTVLGPNNGGANDDREMEESDLEESGDEHEASLGWTNKMNQDVALYDAIADSAFFDGEQDAGDEPEDDYIY